jgi:ribose 1,5-bisphosphokinase
MGPSGAGKDSLLAWVGARLPSGSGQPGRAAIHLARRTITRALRAGDEQHHSVDARTFERLRAEQAFALDWQANGLHYGIRHAELTPLAAGAKVVVNGSRAYLPEALEKFPHLTVVHITTDAPTLRARLLARERESTAAVEARLQRNESLAVPDHAIEIRNDGALAVAGARLLDALVRLR